jgi:hypothetical protein
MRQLVGVIASDHTGVLPSASVVRSMGDHLLCHGCHLLPFGKLSRLANGPATPLFVESGKDASMEIQTGSDSVNGSLLWSDATY